MGSAISKVDSVGVPSRNTERSRGFYVETLELEAKGVEFTGETIDTGVRHMASFKDPDGNELTLHNRYAPYTEGSSRA